VEERGRDPKPVIRAAMGHDAPMPKFDERLQSI